MNQGQIELPSYKQVDLLFPFLEKLVEVTYKFIYASVFSYGKIFKTTDLIDLIDV